MKHYNLGFLGFGNVGRALARLLVAKSTELRERYEIEWSITGVATRGMGWRARREGFQASSLLGNSVDASSRPALSTGINEWLRGARPDVVFETTSLNHETGQPAIDYLTAVLKFGSHAITANKGAVVYGYDELSKLASAAGKSFFFESTVLDSAPVFSLFRETLPAVKLRAFSGIFNSTSNVIIETMEAGRSFDEGVKMAQELGITETDPAHDVDGWDATVKVCALAKVLMRLPLKPSDVRREGIRSLGTQKLQAARIDGKPYKLVARATLSDNGSSLNASVKPEQLASTDPLGNVRGTSLAVHFELDMMPGLTITSHRPSLHSTAYGLLADFINAASG
ncbi:MAG: homoserine dehydrogenase [Pyrinomonadaceae bacterium]|nr:homoserine dehydrogenase [Pyrinomonadaceae bacterium]